MCNVSGLFFQRKAIQFIKYLFNISQKKNSQIHFSPHNRIFHMLLCYNLKFYHVKNEISLSLLNYYQ